MERVSMTKKEELMVITMEECGELIQECSKAIRMKDFNIEELKEEYGIITRMELSNGANVKKMKLLKWSKLL
jgi:endonuclease/exonuclease/phosphatase family metal-dependent hydrolase